MGKWDSRKENRAVSAACIKDKSKEDLIRSKEFLTRLLELRKSQKLSKTYIKGTKNALEYNGHNKVYVDFRFDGTATGRLSCASYNAQKPMGVSFHTLPREEEDGPKNNIRNYFVAPPNWRFLASDYKAMEMRVLAHISGDKAMQKAFIDGADLHTYTAQLIYQKEKISKKERQIAKAISFLIAYGGGAFNLSETVGIPLREAESVISEYARVYPGIFSYMEEVNAFILENGYAQSIFGRTRALPDVRSKDFKVVNRALRQGLNFTIQSPSSDIMVSVILGIRKRFRDLGLESRVVATVHDSLEIISPENEVEIVVGILYDEMPGYNLIREEFGIEFSVPLGIDVEVGTSFGNGEPVEYENGKLIYQEV